MTPLLLLRRAAGHLSRDCSAIAGVLLQLQPLHAAWLVPQARLEGLAWHHAASCQAADATAAAGAAAAADAAGPSHHDHPHDSHDLHDHDSHSHAFEEQERACWSCHDRHHRGGLVCRACDKIQPVDSSLTYFELMGYPQPSYELDPAALERRYKLLQWQLHPDKSVGRTAEEREFSTAQAALINQAYGVLRQPLSRANYMLMLAGASAGEETTIEDPELLMEIMELREDVEAEQDQEALVRLHTANKQRQADVVAQLVAAFRQQDYAEARHLVAQLSYWVRLDEAIQDKL